MPLSSTDDGHQLYFTTQLNLRSAPLSDQPEYRAFRVNEGALEFFAERGNLADPYRGGSGVGVRSLSVSGDGQTVGFILDTICPQEKPCSQTIRAEVRGRYAAILGDATQIWLSRNGEWAVLEPLWGNEPSPPQGTLIHLLTGERTTIPWPTGAVNPVASDGTVLVTQRNPDNTASLGLFHSGAFTPIDLPGKNVPLGISDNARWLFYRMAPDPNHISSILIARDLTTGEDIVLHEGGDSEYPDLLSVSNSGNLVLFRTLLFPPEASYALIGKPYLVNIETRETIPLPLEEGEYALSGTLSGLGTAAFIYTHAGRLLRFDLDAQGKPGPAVELLPPSPFACCSDLPLAPGQLKHLDIGLPNGADWTNRIFLNDIPVPVISSDFAGVTVQIPWEIPYGYATLRTEFPTTSPFNTNQRVFVAKGFPHFIGADPGSNALLGLKMIRGDFSGPVTEQPKPGDIIHLYATGLGRVIGPVVTGQPAPLTELLPLDGYVTCRFTPQPADAETLFVGLAPGTLGYYQLTFRMPPDVGDQPLNGLNCHGNTIGNVVSFR